jgi:hypothetical protein
MVADVWSFLRVRAHMSINEARRQRLYRLDID